jgi:hypothetical protein
VAKRTLRPAAEVGHSVDMLAFDAARVLIKFGSANPDWDEWRNLKNALLKILPLLSNSARESVGATCSRFQAMVRSENEE